MKIQTDSERADIEEANAVRNLLESKGWAILDFLLQEKVSSIKLKMNNSDDPAVIMSCVRHIDGIMFVGEVIQDIISRGDDALNDTAI